MHHLPSRCDGRERKHLLAVALFVAWSLLCVGPSAIAAEKTARHTVMIQGAKFAPDAISVKRGDTIVWVNKDPYPHTVTAPGVFDSHNIVAGGSWRYIAHKAGEFPYACTLHPNMKGTLKVE
ncbi:cupredoxin family copper-binding protein [Cupriavidus sp. 2TAF22]|uniref:cupredoxin domain-containing protein n=1 Tax=unclassified Cupriavidus TaxID=2640874 RepID=UPI003F90E067